MSFSVVIPLYNKARFITRALASVLSQTTDDYEVVVVDDGSTDEGPALVAEYDDPRIKLIRQENQGVSAARNKGIAAATGDWIAFLDADDVWKPDYLQTVADLIGRYPGAGAYATAYEVIKQDGRVVRPKFRSIPPPPWQGLLPGYFRVALGHPPVWTSATTVPKYIFQEVGAFPVGVPLGEDLDMWGRIALRYPIAFSNEARVSYIQEDQHSGSRKHYYFTNPRAAFVGTAMDAIGRNDINSVNLKDLQEYMAKLQIAIGYDCLVDGRNPSVARKILLGTSPGTLRFKWKKYRILLQTFMPDSLAKIVYGDR